MTIVDYVTLIYKARCPECHKDNFVNNGGVSDQTVPDKNGVRCHSCGCEFILGSGVELFEDEIWFTDGLRKEDL